MPSRNPPSKPTLRRYGLSLEEWQEMYDRQDGKCPICLKTMVRANVDHFHVKNWSKMPPEERKQYIRGLICFQDNYRLLGRGMTSERLYRAAQYLEEYEKRKGENK